MKWNLNLFITNSMLVLPTSGTLNNRNWTRYSYNIVTNKSTTERRKKVYTIEFISTKYTFNIYFIMHSKQTGSFCQENWCRAIHVYMCCLIRQKLKQTHFWVNFNMNPITEEVLKKKKKKEEQLKHFSALLV